MKEKKLIETCMHTFVYNLFIEPHRPLPPWPWWPVAVVVAEDGTKILITPTTLITAAKEKK